MATENERVALQWLLMYSSARGKHRGNVGIPRDPVLVHRALCEATFAYVTDKAPELVFARDHRYGMKRRAWDALEVVIEENERVTGQQRGQTYELLGALLKPIFVSDDGGNCEWRTLVDRVLLPIEKAGDNVNEQAFVLSDAQANDLNKSIVKLPVTVRDDLKVIGGLSRQYMNRDLGRSARRADKKVLKYVGDTIIEDPLLVRERYS